MLDSVKPGQFRVKAKQQKKRRSPECRNVVCFNSPNGEQGTSRNTSTQTFADWHRLAGRSRAPSPVPAFAFEVVGVYKQTARLLVPRLRQSQLQCVMQLTQVAAREAWRAPERRTREEVSRSLVCSHTSYTRLWVNELQDKLTLRASRRHLVCRK